MARAKESGPSTINITTILKAQAKMQQEFVEFRKMSVEEMDALEDKNAKLRRRVEADDNGKEKETTENIFLVHRISSHMRIIHENKGESG